MKVAIIMGSNSDWPVLEPAEKVLKDFGVEVEVVVASAHRTPELVKEFAAGARDRGVEAIIAAAGAAAHLGGVIAAYTTLPVIGIPINATPERDGFPAELRPDAFRHPGGHHGHQRSQERRHLRSGDPGRCHPELVQKLADFRARMQEEVKAKGEKLAAARAAAAKA